MCCGRMVDWKKDYACKETKDQKRAETKRNQIQPESRDQRSQTNNYRISQTNKIRKNRFGAHGASKTHVYLISLLSIHLSLNLSVYRSVLSVPGGRVAKILFTIIAPFFCTLGFDNLLFEAIS